MTPKTKLLPKPTQHDPTDLIFLPDRATAVTYKELSYRNANQSPLIFAIPEIDTRYNPSVRGEIVTILARPGHGKTMLAIALSKLWTALLPKTTRSGKPSIVVYVTGEILVEEFIAAYTSGASGQTLAMVGKGTADMTKVQDALINILGTNLVIIGQCADQPNAELFAGGFSIVDVYNTLKLLKETYDIAVVIVDFLQIFPDFHRKIDFINKTAVVSANLSGLRSMAKSLALPMWVLAQASRDVDDLAGLKFPRMSDAQHTSVIEQESNKVFGITKLAEYLDLGQEIELPQPDGSVHVYVVKETSMGLKMIKQRFGGQNKFDRWILDFDWSTATYSIQTPVLIKPKAVDY